MPGFKQCVVSSLLVLVATSSFAEPQKQKGAPRPAASASTAPATKLQGVDELANQAMKEWKVPGVAIAIVQDGKVVYAKGYGYRDQEKKLPVTTGTLFPIGSITKSFTALTFAILNDEGKVDWDQPIRNYRDTLKGDKTIAGKFNKLLRERGLMKGESKYYVSVAHTQADIDHTIAAWSAAIAELKKG